MKCADEKEEEEKKNRLRPSTIAGVKKLRVRVTQCPPSIQTNSMSRNK